MLCRNNFLCFRFKQDFVLLSHVYQMAPGQPQCYLCPLQEANRVTPQEGQLPCVGCQEGPTGRGRPVPTVEADLAVSLLFVSKTLFHPGLDFPVLFLWAEVLSFLLLIIGNRCHWLNASQENFLLHCITASKLLFISPRCGGNG